MTRDHILGWHEKLVSPVPVRHPLPDFVKLYESDPKRVFETVDHSLPVEEGELADNLQLESDGSYSALCCRCDLWGPLYCDITELTPEERTGKAAYEHYCGGSPRCCP